MTDKEQINNLLKNQDKNFNENSTHENKQIIIDGVDVSECLFYQSNFEEDYDVKIKHFCSNWHNSCESANNSNCYFKQLARKTQECERMKYYLNKIRDEELSNLDIEWDEYITEYDTTDYSNIITYVEYALGEKEDD